MTAYLISSGLQLQSREKIEINAEVFQAMQIHALSK